MKKLMTMVLVAACAANAFAMPTKEELKTAQPLVAELMATPMAGFKAAAYKEKSAAAAKVADTSVEFAKAAETEAAKFLLLKGAVSYYVRAEQYDKAADAIKAMQSGVKDIPPAVIVEITGKAAGKISEVKAPDLLSINRMAKLQSRIDGEMKTLAAKLKNSPSDALRRRYAESLAISGNWKSAYAEFIKVKDTKLQSIAESEATKTAKNEDIGEFWWSYKPTMPEAKDFFKAHAAAAYRRALNAGEITGLRKSLIEQRIKGVREEVDPFRSVVKNSVESILNGMIRVPNRDYWLSATELTQGQWDAVMGSNQSVHKGVNLPVENISKAECDAFLEKLNQTKEVQASPFKFMLPGHIEWAYAAIDGCPGDADQALNTAWKNGNVDGCPGAADRIRNMAWLQQNSGDKTHEVATKEPNAFGFYDMIGNVCEFMEHVVPGKPNEVHGKGSAYCTPVSGSSPHRHIILQRDQRIHCCGVRLMARLKPVPDLVGEGKARNGKK